MAEIDSMAACGALGWPLIRMRQLRAAGFLDGLGKKSGKAYVFHAGDFVQIALASYLRLHGFSLPRSFGTARANAVAIRSAMSSATNGDVIVRIPLDADKGYSVIDEQPATESMTVAFIVLNLSELGRRALARLSAL